MKVTIEDKHEKLKLLLKQIQDANLLPKGFYKTMMEKYDVSRALVYRVMNGESVKKKVHQDIIDDILNAAEESKIDQQIQRAQSILESWFEKDSLATL